MRIERPIMCNKQRLVAGLLVVVIALTTVISAAPSTEEIKSPETSQLTAPTKTQEATSSSDNNKKSLQEQSTVIEVNNSPAAAVAIEQPANNKQINKNVKSELQEEVAEKTSAAAGPEAEANGKRKGKAEAATSDEAAQATSATVAEGNKDKTVSADQKASSQSDSSTKQTKQESKSTSSTSPSPSNKNAKQPVKGSTKNKLPANLGTVTSTGSGSAHYMSKHDAYSAIAEKHGALAHNTMRKSDKQRGGGGGYQGFGGIQKASGGLGDMFGPFKGVTDSGLARTLGASMRSIIKGKYSVPAYVASALLGAVALMAFYESPISPLPVPPLPEPPVGRFPPEMPNISPNVQVPFRGNQQQYNQNYNQRSLNVMPQVNNLAYTAGMTASGQQQQQQQQVLFPGPMQQQAAQQRQMTTSSGASNSIQQMAANFLNTVAAKQQNAQRKSGVDFDLPQSPSLLPSGRSFFGSSVQQQSLNQNNRMMSAQNNQQKQSTGSSFLSFFGLGGASSPSQAPPSTPMSSGDLSQQQSQQNNMVGVNQMLGGQQAGLSSASNSFVEQKGNNNFQQLSKSANSVLSNSHLVNKVKSFFSRSGVTPMGGSSSGAGVSNSNPYDQYQKMSFVQAFMKDTAFLPAFLTPTRKSSNSASPLAGGNKLQTTISNVLQANNANNGNQPAARMSHSSDNIVSNGAASTNSKSKPASAGYGVVRAADRIAQALLETFTSGLARSAQPASASSSISPPSTASSESAARKSNDDGNQSLAMATTSLLSDIMSSYGGSSSSSSQSSDQQQQSQSEQSQQNDKSAASGRSADGSSSVVSTNSGVEENQHKQGEPLVSPVAPAQSTANNKHQSAIESGPPSASSAGSVQATAQQSSLNNHQSSSATLSRKTRSVGFEYPIESNQELAQRESHPSKATQINNVIDYVTDSYSQNRLLFNFVMNQFGLSQAVPYVEQILTTGNERQH